MAIEIDQSTVLLVWAGVIPLVVFLIAWVRLGGWPEAWYRLRRTPYFIQRIFEADGSCSRYVHKMSIVIRHSPAMFDFKGETWMFDEKCLGRDTGRPAIYYNFDDTDPINYREWSRLQKIPPSLVFKAFHNDTIEKMHQLGSKRSPTFWILLVIAVLVVVIVAGIGAYYSYNTFCAVTPAKCGAPVIHG